MCFFDQHRFKCGDWKWGHFRQHCAKEYRIGDTCGMKLIMQTVPVDQKCKLCEKIDTKMRRRQAEVDRVSRWQREGHKFRASIEKSMEVIRWLDGEIYELSCERNRRLQGIGSGVESQLDNTRASDTSGYVFVEKKDGRRGLPITFPKVEGPATIMANPDTGAAVNAISLVIARKLGLKVDPTEDDVVLASGNYARCCGITRAWCQFGKTYDTESDELHCTFYVFRKLASPLIMCRSFLLETKTITTFLQRLVRLRCSIPIIPIIGALGGTEERLLCCVNGHNAEALPDSGSDVDVVSLQYAERQGFAIKPSDAWVMFADRTVRRVSGTATVQLTVGHGARKVDLSVPRPTSSIVSIEAAQRPTNKDFDTDTSPTSSTHTTPVSNMRHVLESTFYVLADITVDMIIGTESLETLEVYTRHSAALVKHAASGKDLECPALNRIVLLSSIERRLRQISRSWVLRMRKRQPQPAVSNVSFQQLLIDADAEELARRESNGEKLAKLCGAERLAAEQVERRRQEEYARYRNMIVGALNMPAQVGDASGL